MDKRVLNTLLINESLSPAEIKKCIYSLFSFKGGRTHEGNMPIEFFNRNEKAIRKWMRASNRRVFYRGPRVSNNTGPLQTPSMTRRCDATSVQFGYR